MKTKEISEKYNIDQKDFDAFLITRNLNYSENLLGIINVDDALAEEYVSDYKRFREKENQAKEEALKQKKEEEERRREEEEPKKAAMAKMLISSGFSFDGYRIVKYSGYISGDDAIEISRTGWFSADNESGQNITNALVKIRRQALNELKEAAYNLGCNAIIGVDFDYITLETPSGTGTLYEPYVICVTANGNAVIIEKDEP